jgi:uncharacterized protein (TIGR03435 family)
VATDVTMAHFAGMLGALVRRPVVDQTGLMGAFRLTLDYTPDGTPGRPAGDGPSISTAIQEQLGLRLQPTRAAVEVLVIDRADLPDPN